MYFTKFVENWAQLELQNHEDQKITKSRVIQKLCESKKFLRYIKKESTMLIDLIDLINQTTPYYLKRDSTVQHTNIKN